MTQSTRERALEAALTLAIHGLDNDGQASACAALNTKGRAALALPSSPPDADMLAALQAALPFVDYHHHYGQRDLTAGEAESLAATRLAVIHAIARATGKEG